MSHKSDEQMQGNAHGEETPNSLRVPAERGGTALAKRLCHEITVIHAPLRHTIHSVGGHTHTVSAVFLSDDGTRLATGSFDKTAKVWDVDTGRCLWTYEGHTSHVNTVFLNADGTRLVTGSLDGTAKLWDVDTGRCLRTYEGHLSSVESASLSADGTYLVTGSADRTAKLWDVPTARCLRTYQGHTFNVRSVRLATGASFHGQLG